MNLNFLWSNAFCYSCRIALFLGVCVTATIAASEYSDHPGIQDRLVQYGIDRKQGKAPPPPGIQLKSYRRVAPGAADLVRYSELVSDASRKRQSHVEGVYIVRYNDETFRYAIRQGRLRFYLNDDGLSLEDLSQRIVDRVGGSLLHAFTTGPGYFAAILSEAQASAISRLPGVKSVTPDVVGSFESWALDRSNQRNRLPLDGNKIMSLVTGTTVNMYIIDSGVLTSHSEFQGRVGAGFSFFAGTSQHYDNAGSFADGHGTSVASVAMGSTVGVAQNALLHSVRISNSVGDTGAVAIAAGVNWVRDNWSGPAVVNMSVGAAMLSDGHLIQDAVEDLIAEGVTVVVAAGNSAIQPTLLAPANVPEAIVVAASDADDVIASFSNWGSLIDLFAPGVDVRCATNSGNTNFAFRSGTSFSAPLVAGIAALYLSHNPGASPADVRASIVANATRNAVVGANVSTPNYLAFARPDWIDPDVIVTGGAGSVLANNVNTGGQVVDHVNMTGANVTVRADWQQIARVSWIDENDDIVFAEISGPGSLSIQLEGATGPALPVKYNQAVNYMKGRAILEVYGATENTNISSRTVGTANSSNPGLFLPVAYDGVADLKLLMFKETARVSRILMGNSRFVGTSGTVGVDAESAAIVQRFVVLDVDASGSASPRLYFGNQSTFTTDSGRPIVAGGNLVNTNGSRIVVRGTGAAPFAALVSNANANSHGVAMPPLALNNSRLGSASVTYQYSYVCLNSGSFPVLPPGSTSAF